MEGGEEGERGQHHMLSSLVVRLSPLISLCGTQTRHDLRHTDTVLDPALREDMHMSQLVVYM